MGDRQRLWRKAKSLRSKMRKLGFMIQGSVLLRRMRCGKSNCRCNRGYPHEVWCVTYKEKGKTKTVYIDKGREAEALSWSRDHKKYRALLRELTLVNLELLRSPRS